MADPASRKHPLTPSQQQFWKGHLLSPNRPLYNMAWRFELGFDVNPEVFCRAFGDVAAASDVMSSVFVDIEGVPFQCRGDTLPAPVAKHDVSSEADPDHRLSKLEAAMIAAPFDLGTSSYRTALIKRGPSDWLWIFIQHHIACDAQSGVVLVDAVSARYEQLLANSGAALPLSLQPFFERADTLASQAGEASALAQAAPWSLYGVNGPACGNSTRVSAPLPQSFFDDLETLSVTLAFRLFTPDLTRFALILTAYAAYLGRTGGQETLRIGIPSHNRMSQKDRATLGLYVEVLPIEIMLDQSDSFESLFAKVKAELGSFLKQARPNAILNEGAQQFDHVLNFSQARFDGFAGHPMHVHWQHSGAHDHQHGMRLQVMNFDGSTQPSFALDIQDEVLKDRSAEQIAGHFTRFLQGCCADTQMRLSDIAMTDAEETANILHLCDGPATSAIPQPSVLASIIAQCASTPDAIALQCGAETVSYAALLQRSETFAAHLTHQGLIRGERVVVHMERSVNLMVAILGILRAGGAFVPIAAQTPIQRLEDIAKRAKARFAITEGVTKGRFATTNIVECHPSRHVDHDPVALPQINADDLAYVLYTSGSTGVPKGVAVSHHALNHYITWAAQTFGPAPSADYALCSTISFDLTLTSMFTPLMGGGTVRIYPERADPDLAVLDVFEEDAVDVVKLTPSHLAAVCAVGRPVKRIKNLVLGGENLSVMLAKQAQDVLSPDLTIFNEYGPTEAVVGCMVHRFERATDVTASVAIGRPAAGLSITIRDSAQNVLPLGVAGEICIAGRLANGYDDAPAETNRVFLDDPLAPGTMLYRSGDIGCLHADGHFTYQGRGDQQLKIGGVRVERGEIEHALRQVSGVQGVHISQGAPEPATDAPHCLRCGISATYPDLTMHADGICNICHEYETYKDRAKAYFQPVSALEQRIATAANRSTGKYDVIMLLSGGKDSTYAAYRLGQMTSRVLAVTLDNGYISEEAKANIDLVSADLGWDHKYLTTDAMNDIFVDSLKSHSNVCQGCFKTVYTLAMREARAQGAAAIVTGLSRGQFFETRLTPDLFKTVTPSTQQLDQIVHEARRTYHTEDDAISVLLQTDDFKDGSILQEVEVIDLYRYVDVPVSEIFAYLSTQTAWRRPSDTGRSTNCLINDVGIFLHREREGFHNYALPYSWDVRMGHKTRAQAMAELDDTIDRSRVETILHEIGFDEPIKVEATATSVVAYVAANTNVSEDALWSALDARLPRVMHPQHIVLLDHLPLTGNGKVATAQLPRPNRQKKRTHTVYTPATTDMERQLVALFEQVLGQTRIGIHDDFFDLGIESLFAITLAIKANEQGLPLPATALFEHRTIAALAAFSEGMCVSKSPVEAADDPLLDLDQTDLDAVSDAFS